MTEPSGAPPPSPPSRREARWRLGVWAGLLAFFVAAGLLAPRIWTWYRVRGHIRDRWEAIPVPKRPVPTDEMEAGRFVREVTEGAPTEEQRAHAEALVAIGEPALLPVARAAFEEAHRGQLDNPEKLAEGERLAALWRARALGEVVVGLVEREGREVLKERTMWRTWKTPQAGNDEFIMVRPFLYARHPDVARVYCRARRFPFSYPAEMRPSFPGHVYVDGKNSTVILTEAISGEHYSTGVVGTSWFDPRWEFGLLLAQHPRAGGAEELATLLADGEPLVRLRAVMASGRFKDARTLGPLVKVLETDPAPDVRARAAEGLSWLADRRAAPALTRRLAAESDLRVRKVIAEALSEFDSPEVVAALEKESYPLARVAEAMGAARLDFARARTYLMGAIEQETDAEAAEALRALLRRHEGKDGTGRDE